MSDFDAKQLAEAVDGVKRGFEAFKEANDQRIKEIEAKGAADPLLDEKIAKIEKEMDAKQARLDQFELSIKRQNRTVTDEHGNEVNLDQKARNWANEAASYTKREAPDNWGVDSLNAYKAAFKQFMRNNFDRSLMSDNELKTLSVGQDSSGGYFVYPDLSGQIVLKVFETSPMRAYASVQAIGTDALEGYYDNDEVGFGWVSELEARPATTTPVIGKWRIPVHEMYAMPEASQTVLDDAILDLESWLNGKIADRFARAENNAFVAGDGVSKPRGFLTYPDGTDLTNSIERFDTGVNGAFAAAPSGGDVLINALYGLKAQYRANATWFMNRATTSLTRKLKDSDGAYLWSPGIAAGQPATLLGYPVASFEDMPDPATGSLSIAVGDMRRAYQIVDRIGIRMLRDPYSSKPKILFYATKRTGGDMLNGEALKIVAFKS
jgi:HK97 family phage major capsid protein